MKLLYDQNLPPRLVATLAPQFPDSRHVSHVGLDRADDFDVWMFAQREGFTIVSLRKLRDLEISFAQHRERISRSYLKSQAGLLAYSR